MKKDKWPKSIYGLKDSDSEYLEKIKSEYIVSAGVERDDPFYETVASLWNISLNLDVDGQKRTIFNGLPGLEEAQQDPFAPK